MMQPATVSSRAEHARPGVGAWIIGRTSDLTWLIGGALVAYGLLAAHLFLGVAAVTIYVVWVLAIDGPHVFATLSRTYLDGRERATRARLLGWSLCLFALGPAAVGLSVVAGRRLPYDLFLTFCSLWAYWHIVRQHYGVMVLYEKKAGEPARGDGCVDGICLQVACLAPLVAFALGHPRARAMLGMTAPPAWGHAVSVAAWSVFAAAISVLAARQVTRVLHGRALNGRKLLFVTAAISVSGVLFSPPVAARIEYEAVFPIITSFHDVQYLAIVWFFHQNRLAPVGGRPRAVPVFARRLSVFLGAGVLFTVAYRVLLGCLFSAWPGCDVGTQNILLPGGLAWSDVGVGFLWGFALHHYYLDQRIWHVRRDVALGRDLRLDRLAPNARGGGIRAAEAS
jgi:hypothetical protein